MKKNSKKRLMAMLMGMLFVLSAGSAYAQVNINSTTDNPVTYYDGIAINSTTGTELGHDGGVVGANLNLTCKLGAGIAGTSQRFLRFDLSNNAKFKENPSCMIDISATSRVLGGASYSYVIFNPVSTINASPDVNVAVTVTASGITVYNTNPVTVTYTQYESLNDAQSKTNAVSAATATTKYIAFGTTVGWEVVPVTPYTIDVTTGSKLFNTGSGTTTKVNTIGHVKIFNSTTPVYNQAGTATIGIDDIVDPATTKFTVTGDFSALQDSSVWVPANKRVWLDSTPATACNNTLKEGELLTLSATKAEFKHDSAILADTLVCMEVNGINAISSGTYNGLYDVAPNTGYSQADIDLGVLSELKKNGSKARVTFLLTPDSMYKTYVRIVNPSETNGAVYLTLSNDSGNSVTFNLSTVAGLSTSTSMTIGLLKARASTPLISMTDIVTAAKLSNPTFDATAGKLRIDAEAEFGQTMASNYPGSCVVINAFSMMSDGTGFIMMPY